MEKEEKELSKRVSGPIKNVNGLSTEKKRRRRTDHELATEIEEGACKLIEKYGFPGLTVRALVQETDIDPALFYRRFSNIESFIYQFVRRYDYWLNDYIEAYDGDICSREGYRFILQNLFKELGKSKIMRQLLRWEVGFANEITHLTANARELHTQPLVRMYVKKFPHMPVDIGAISSILMGGIYYVVIHGRLSPFARIDLSKKKGRQMTQDAINLFVDLLFDRLEENNKLAEAARKMKDDGMSEELILKYTGFTEEQYMLKEGEGVLTDLDNLRFTGSYFEDLYEDDEID